MGDDVDRERTFARPVRASWEGRLADGAVAILAEAPGAEREL